MPIQFALISIAKHTNILCETHDHEAKSFLVFLKFKLCIWWQATQFSRINLLQLPETKQWSISWLIEILCSLVVSFRNVSLVLKQNVLTTCLHFHLCHQSSNIWRSFILRKLLNQLPFFSLFYKWVLLLARFDMLGNLACIQRLELSYIWALMTAFDELVFQWP